MLASWYFCSLRVHVHFYTCLFRSLFYIFSTLSTCFHRRACFPFPAPPISMTLSKTDFGQEASLNIWSLKHHRFFGFPLIMLIIGDQHRSHPWQVWLPIRLRVLDSLYIFGTDGRATTIARSLCEVGLRKRSFVSMARMKWLPECYSVGLRASWKVQTVLGTWSLRKFAMMDAHRQNERRVSGIAGNITSPSSVPVSC